VVIIRASSEAANATRHIPKKTSQKRRSLTMTCSGSAVASFSVCDSGSGSGIVPFSALVSGSLLFGSAGGVSLWSVDTESSSGLIGSFGDVGSFPDMILRLSLGYTLQYLIVKDSAILAEINRP
jgi:hypothetical protein